MKWTLVATLTAALLGGVFLFSTARPAAAVQPSDDQSAEHPPSRFRVADAGVVRVNEKRDYDITFSARFSEPPIVIVSGAYGGGPEPIAAVRNLTADGCAVRLVNGNNLEFRTGEVHWIAIRR